MIYSGDDIYSICRQNIKAGQHTFIVRGEEIPVEILIEEASVVYSKDQFLGNSTPDKEMLILKCNGDITINPGVTVKPITRKKGFVIFTPNKLINKGTITMSTRGAVAPGQNVYLYSDEFIPAIGGGTGARGYHSGYSSTYYDAPGANGTNRGTGGGGCGGSFYGYGSIGSAGTSFSGGTGGGGLCRATSLITTYDGKPNGGAGGDGRCVGAAWTCSTGGGAGNPGGVCHQYNTSAGNGENGTGGLLIIYAIDFENYGSITSNGSIGGWGYRASGGGSGGGSINIFYNTKTGSGTCTANGGLRGEATRGGGEKVYGGNGGNGTITYMWIRRPSDYKCVMRDKNKTVAVHNNEIVILPHDVTDGQVLQYGVTDANLLLEKTVMEDEVSIEEIKKYNDTHVYKMTSCEKAMFTQPKFIRESDANATVFNTITPVMTSNTSPAPSVVFTSNAFGGSAGYMAFDGKGTTAWMCSGATGWIMIDLGQANYANKIGIGNGSGSGMPSASTLKDFRVLGSVSQGGPFVELLNVTGAAALSAGTTKEHKLNNADYYRFYRIEFTANNGNTTYTSIGRISLFEESKTMVRQLLYHDGHYYNDQGIEVQGDTMYDFSTNGVDGRFDIFSGAPDGYEMHIYSNSGYALSCIVGRTDGSVLDNVDDDCEIITVKQNDMAFDTDLLSYEAVPYQQSLHTSEPVNCSDFLSFALTATGDGVKLLITFNDREWYGYDGSQLVEIMDFLKDLPKYGVLPQDLTTIPYAEFAKYINELNQFKLCFTIPTEDDHIDGVSASGVEKDSYESTLVAADYTCTIIERANSTEMNINFLKQGKYIINY